MKLVGTALMVLCLNVYAYALSESLINEMREKTKLYGLECAETINVPPDDLTALIQKRVPKTHEGKCLIYCVAQKIKMMSDDGSFGEGDVEWLAKVKVDDPDVYDKMLDTYDKCKTSTSNDEDPCEKATHLIICVFNQSQKNGLDKYLEM